MPDIQASGLKIFGTGLKDLDIQARGDTKRIIEMVSKPFNLNTDVHVN